MTVRHAGAGALFAACALLPAVGIAQTGIKSGFLKCNVESGLGLIITSTKDLACTYTSANGEFVEYYVGTIKKFGLDIGSTDRGTLSWEVIAPTAGRMRGALAGDYIGASASATVGVGLGANALVGGSNRSIALQPLSIQGQTGLNIAGGVASLSLRPARA